MHGFLAAEEKPECEQTGNKRRREREKGAGGGRVQEGQSCLMYGRAIEDSSGPCLGYDEP